MKFIKRFKLNAKHRDCIDIVYEKRVFNLLPSITFIFDPFGQYYIKASWLFWEVSYFHDSRYIDDDCIDSCIGDCENKLSI